MELLLIGTRRATKILGFASLIMIAIGSIPKSTQAATIVSGSDYWITQSSSFFDFGSDIGVVNFIGDPIGEFMGRAVGNADTIVQRKDDVNLDGGFGTTGLQIQALSLRSVNPVNGFNVFIGLTEGEDIKQEVGDLTIKDDKTFESRFTVDWTARFEHVSGSDDCPLVFQNCSVRVTDLMGSPTLFEGDGNWSDTFQGGIQVEGLVGDSKANVHTNLGSDQQDFFVVGTVTHDASGAGHHDVSAVSEPVTTILGSIVALGCGTLIKGKKSRRQKQL